MLARVVEHPGTGALLPMLGLEVLRYPAFGWDNANMVDESVVILHVVRNDATNLRRRLDVRSSLEGVVVAVRLGILTLGGG